MSINRNGREFLGIWRGSREFTELHRGGRVLWQKEGGGGEPEEPKRRIAKLTLTAANKADFAVVEYTRHYIGRGSKGSIRANIGGEAHSLSGEAAPLRTSTLSISKCQSASLLLDAGTVLREGDLAVGDTITVTAEQAGNHDSNAIQCHESNGYIFGQFYCPLVDNRIVTEIQFWGCANGSQTLAGTAKVLPGSTSANSEVNISRIVSLTRNKTVKAFYVNFSRDQINTFCASGLNTGYPYVRAYLNPTGLMEAFKSATDGGSITMEWGWNDYSLNLSFTITEIEYAD
ncbi:MAG: hypothetical protein IKJ58_02210 [Akkermansia sp.]|nr:hypothetical protein [Akkermansia sp.]